MTTVKIRFYDFARNGPGLTDEKAKEFTALLSEYAQEEIVNNGNGFRSVIKEDLLKFESGLHLDIKELESKLRLEIKESKIDSIKWMVTLFITLALMIVGLYFKS